MSFILYENPLRKEKIEIELPVRCLVEMDKIRDEAGIPRYLDCTDFQMKKLIAILWSSTHLADVDRAIYEKRAGQSMPVAVFGGAGFRLHCPSLNDKHSPFHRHVKDIDLLILKKDAHDWVEILCHLHDTLGNMHFHTTTHSDRRFNLLRRGDRYRLTTLCELSEDGTPVPGILELFSEKLCFCHKFILTDEVQKAKDNFFTIGLENLILLKTQFIKKVHKSELTPEHEYRILQKYDKNSVLIGMEDKDMRDVAAAIFDHELGVGNDFLNIDQLGTKLLRDWGTWKTCAMNLENMRRNLESVVNKYGASQVHRETIDNRLASMLEFLNNKYRPKKPALSFGNKQWWEDVEEQVR